MRHCFLMLFSLVALCRAMSQEVASFKVLYAESAFVVGNKPTVLDELFDQDNISSNGLLILVHRTGKFIAIEGDTLVSIKEMSQAILQSLNMSSCDNERPDFGMLLSESARRRWTGAVTAGMPDIEWVIPPKRTAAHPRQTIALLWDPVGKSEQEFELHFSTIFDDPIGKPYRLTSDRLVLWLDTVKVDEEVPLLLADVRLRNDKYPRSTYASIKLSETSYALPDTFEAITAIKALEIAFNLEVNNGAEYAKPYYEQAVELSDHLFYRQMLEAFKKRRAG